MSKKAPARRATATHRAQPTAQSTRRIAVKNPLVRESIHCENAAVRTLAEAFNTKDVHSRRALLKHAATFAGTVADDVALELGTVKPAVIVAAPARQAKRTSPLPPCPPTAATRTSVELVDDLNARIFDQRAIAKFTEAVFQICADDIDAGSGTQELADGLWEGLAVLARRADEGLDAIHSAVNELHERRQGTEGGAR